MVGPLKSEQIALSFGNSVIIVGVRARIINLASLFYKTEFVSHCWTEVKFYTLAYRVLISMSSVKAC